MHYLVLSPMGESLESSEDGIYSFESKSDLYTWIAENLATLDVRVDPLKGKFRVSNYNSNEEYDFYIVTLDEGIIQKEGRTHPEIKDLYEAACKLREEQNGLNQKSNVEHDKENRLVCIPQERAAEMQRVYDLYQQGKLVEA